MYFVQCPECGSVVEIPRDAIGPQRTDRWNVTECAECRSTFDFDDEQVQFAPDVQGIA